MKRDISIRLTGANVAETAKVLQRRVIELGSNAHRIDEAASGIVVLAIGDGPPPEDAVLAVEVSEYDTPDFAAEKILDELGEAGVLDLEATDYSPEEEERIRARLADLGYID